ncbi:MAG: hypothetical protein U5K43_02715 [Halofilum sp. (in: g-proteobacteria)]|nr:hypothetical protein [Halofilum sp. (in: g-proteobacteria)]
MQPTDAFLRRRRRVDRSMRVVLFLAATVSVLVTAGIVFVLVRESITFFQDVSIVEFLTGHPLDASVRLQAFRHSAAAVGDADGQRGGAGRRDPGRHAGGDLPGEFAPNRVRETVKPILELLEGIPTVVYGYFALLFVTPLLQLVFPGSADSICSRPGWSWAS